MVLQSTFFLKLPWRFNTNAKKQLRIKLMRKFTFSAMILYHKRFSFYFPHSLHTIKKNHRFLHLGTMTIAYMQRRGIFSMIGANAPVKHHIHSTMFCTEDSDTENLKSSIVQKRTKALKCTSIYDIQRAEK